ncbi:hypothetical protein [Methylobacterium sp. J-077]|uniref:hypothetical protein n=1 Tax=Methylobacterium sp. J-077 TaxID=2836656 RepID=UPI001FB93C3C|nr:hypothetical protein [Methylobacterium sp. J-077]MCJ2121363.1 hypothetical protein [Methylobacterium sp. J-077]
MVVLTQQVLPAHANIDKQETEAAARINVEVANAATMRMNAKLHENFETIDLLLAQAISTLNQLKSADRSGNPYYFARDEDLRRAKDVYERLVTDLTILKSHTAETKKRDDAEAEGNAHVTEDLAKVKSFEGELSRDDPRDGDIPDLYREITTIYRNAEVPALDGTHRYKAASPSKVAELLRAYAPLVEKVKKLQELDTARETRKKQAEDDSARIARGEPTSEGAATLSLMSYYIIADICASRGYAFDSNEVAGIKGSLAKRLDDNRVPQQARDKTWQAMQAGLNATGFRTMPDTDVSRECANSKQSAFYLFPDVFNRSNATPKNPF